MLINKIKNEALSFFKNYKFDKYINELNKYYFIKYKNINLHILYKNKLNLEFTYRLLKRAYVITKYINKTFNIYLVLTDFKKKFNKNFNIPLNQNNVNSGFTYIGNNNNVADIYLLRYEEYPKVLIHELIHHINSIHNNFKLSNILKLKKHFNIQNNDIDINECIIEFWATILHLYFVSIDYKLDLYKLFIEELKYSLYKSNQLLQIQKNNNNIWNDYTNVYCYIIFKTILLYNIDEFLKIYTFPYNDDIITDFLIKYSKLPPFISNKWSSNSLRFMIYSNL